MNFLSPTTAVRRRQTSLVRLTAGLLGAVCFSALLAGSASADPDVGDCVLEDTTVTCSGAAVSDGVDIGDVGVTDLIVNGLTGDINPVAGLGGVVLDTTNAASVDIDLGDYAIKAGGTDMAGVYVSAWGDEENPTDASLTLKGDVESLDGQGVVVTGSGAATSNTTGDIVSLDQALTVKGWGGPVEVDHTGTLTSQEGGGLYAEAKGGSDINVQGDIDALGDGIRSHNWGDGLTTLVANGDIIAHEGSGIVVEEDNSTANLDLDGSIEAAGDAVSVKAYGDVTIDQRGAVTTYEGTGIYANSSTGSVEITRDATVVHTQGDGIVADAHGDNGHVIINTPGTVTSDDGRGVVATASNGNVDITLGGATIAKQDAIWAEANGAGALGVDIDSNGAVTSYDGQGIYAKSTGTGFTDGGKTFGVRIDQAGDVTAKLDAVTAIATNSNVDVKVTGNVTSYDGDGLHAESANGTVKVEAGTVTSGLDAVYAHSGNGEVTVDVGTVLSNGGNGVYAQSDEGNVGVTIDGTVTSELDAIYAQSKDGTVTIDTGTVLSNKGNGIYAQSDSGAVEVTIGGDVTGDLDAIEAVAANGPVTVNVTGGVVANNGQAIEATSSNGAVYVDVGADVTAGGKGIHAETSTGRVDVIVAGDVTANGEAVRAITHDDVVNVAIDGDVVSYDDAGIHAESSGGSVTIDAGDVTSQLDAVYAQSNAGPVDIDLGDVISYSGNGIYGQSNGGSVDIDAGDITTELDAIYAQSDADTVTVGVGDVLSNKGKGIYAQSDSATVDVTAGSVTSELDAIYAQSEADAVSITTDDVTSYKGDAITAGTGSGAITIDVGGDLSAGGKGVSAVAGSGTVDVTVNGGVSSGLDAINVASGEGAVTLNVTGGVNAEDGDAVRATSGNGAVYANIGGDVDAGGKGVYADSGSGRVDVIVAGHVDAAGDAVYAASAEGIVAVDIDGSVSSEYGAGIYAQSLNGDVSVAAGDVTSELDAIYAQSSSGAIDIDLGEILSKSGKGIYAQSDDGAVDLTLAGGVGSELDAIYAATANGAVTLNVTGGVTSTSGQAIEATSSNGAVYVNVGDDVSAGGKGIHAETESGRVDVIVAGKVSSGGDAVYAATKDEAVNVDIDGDVSSETGIGIHADSSGGSVTVGAADVTSQLDAIYAHSKAAPVEVTVGEVTSYGGDAIYAQSNGGTVKVTTTGDVTSEQDAIYAQSNAGSVTVDTKDVLANKGKGIYAQSKGGEVEVNAGTLTSELDGIYAQSDTGPVTITTTGGVTSYKGRAVQGLADGGAIDIDLGGDVWAGAEGIYAVTESGTVDISVDGDVTATLDAIYAQSDDSAISIEAGAIESYDGRGVYAVTDSGTVDVTLRGDVVSQLDGVYAESKDSAVTVDLGGGVTSYDGKGVQALTADGDVTIDIDGAVVSQGDAVTAKTTGGDDSSTVKVTTAGVTSYSGRGIVADSTRQTVTIHNTGELTAELGGIVANSTGAGALGAVEVTQHGMLTSYKGMGIDASSASGPVTVTTTGGIETELDGIVATSLDGDDTGTVSVTNSDGDIVSYKGSGIVASSAREGVTVTNTGKITADKDGISASSTGNTETSDVIVKQTGDIVVGKGAGIRTSSLVDTTITLDGDITGGEFGINATSLAGAIEASVAQGSVISGSSTGAVYLNSETTALLTNHGNISSDWGYGVKFDGNGVATLDNYGTISGDFMSAGAGTFNNYLGATYNAGTQISFGGGGTFSNYGTVSLSTGDQGSALQDTVVTGNFVQSSTGRLYADAKLGNDSSDRLLVSGTASLAGSLTVNLEGDLDDGVLGDYDFFSATGGLTINGLTLSNPTLYSVIVSDGTNAAVRISDINFNPEGVSTKNTQTSSYIDNVFTAGTPQDLKPLLLALANTPDLPSYEAALDQLTPEQYSQDVQNSYGANIAFSNRLLSCRVADGPNRFKAEGDCDWFGTRMSVLDQDQTDDTTAFEQTFATLEAGSQRRLDDNWRLGGGVAFTNAITRAADGSSSNAVEGQAGVVVKYDKDALLLASALSGGYSVHSDERHIVIGALDDTLSGDAGIAYLSARLHAAYTFELGDAAYIKPLFSLDLTATRFGGVTESGGSGALTIDPGMQYVATFNPAIEIGGEISDGSGMLLRPFVQVGYEASLATDMALSARFDGVDPSLGSLTLEQADAEPAAKISIGADMLNQDSATVRLYYDGAFTASSRKNGLGLKMSNTFD